MNETIQRLTFIAFGTALTLLASSLAAQTAALSLVKSASTNPVAPNTTLTYFLQVSNEGPDDAANTSVSDPLPAGTTFQAINAPAGWTCSTPAIGSNGTISCSTPDLPVGTAVISVDVLVGALPNGTVLTNTATTISTTPDNKPDDNIFSINTTVETPVAILTLTKTGSPNPVEAGTNLTYTITAANNSNSDFDSASVTDPLPANTTFVSLAPPGGWSCTTPAMGANGTVNCDIAPLAQTSTSVFTLVVQVPASTPAGLVTNTASLLASANGRDSTLQATAVTQVQIDADLQVSNDDSPDPVVAGSNLAYTIGIENPGPSDADPTTLTDSLPAGTTFVSLASPGGWSCTTPAAGAGGTISCSGPVAALTTATFTLTVKTDASIAGGTTLTDVATASFAPDSNTGNNSATATTTVNLNPVTTTTISAPTVTYPADGVVTVTVSSPGTAPTGNVTLSVDGGAPLTQALVPINGTSSSATFTIMKPAIGTHTLEANYAAQGPFDASSASGTLLVITPIPTLGGRELLLLAAVLAIMALLTLGRFSR